MKNDKKYNHWFYAYNTTNYYYKANGDKWMHALKADRKSAGWNEGDIITLVYNGCHRQLSLLINNKHDENSIQEVEECEGGFRVVVYLYSLGDKIELLTQ